jgi:small-conductance mechanosensitive channel
MIFYVSYEINAYIKEPNKQALIYSMLHQNIQDICNERGIEIMSPHYRAAEMETIQQFQQLTW